MPLIEDVHFRRSSYAGLWLRSSVDHFNVTGLRFEANAYGLLVERGGSTCTMETCHVSGNTFTANTYGTYIAGLAGTSPRPHLVLSNNSHIGDSIGYDMGHHTAA